MGKTLVSYGNMQSGYNNKQIAVLKLLCENTKEDPENDKIFNIELTPMQQFQYCKKNRHLDMFDSIPAILDEIFGSQVYLKEIDNACQTLNIKAVHIFLANEN